MSDLDPAAIMAEHEKFGAGTECWARCIEPWPCLPYRLAVDLVEAQERARVHAAKREAFIFGYREGRDDAAAGIWTDDPATPYGPVGR